MLKGPVRSIINDFKLGCSIRVKTGAQQAPRSRRRFEVADRGWCGNRPRERAKSINHRPEQGRWRLLNDIKAERRPNPMARNLGRWRPSAEAKAGVICGKLPKKGG